ncbi:MAG: biotin--[acetyl-CoA-carboxylase] ligase [Oculatellaceae cyanobacterium Prado106]|jgi:BirA family biotin operon repressor/biotin-[acetyl-CoA-carboxylase] ligase|nr:biotin--[acetyl-CoA-carboxylase] ligase [Oculatellaceae cyanobacterium Prado106]
MNLQPQAIAPPSPQPDWLYWLDQCSSTNSWAIAHRHLPVGAVVFTPQQTAGRGQKGRTWHSPAGGLTASFVVDSIPVEQFPRLSLLAGLAVIYAIEDLIPTLQQQLKLKWMNDIWWGDRKLAGILCESALQSAESQGRVIIGIGLNHTVDFTTLDAEQGTQLCQTAVSLHTLTQSVPDIFTILDRIRFYLLQMSSLLQWWQTSDTQIKGWSILLAALRQRDALLGKQVTMQLPAIGEQDGEQVVGIGVGVGDRGELMLRLGDGGVRSIIAGHIVQIQG